MCGQQLYERARRITRAAFGRAMGLHDFRRAAHTFLAMEAPEGAVGFDDLKRLLGQDAIERPQRSVTESGTEYELDDGLPALMARDEKRFIEEAIRRHPDLTRAELSDKLKISESALYKKLRHHDIRHH